MYIARVTICYQCIGFIAIRTASRDSPSNSEI